MYRRYWTQAIGLALVAGILFSCKTEKQTISVMEQKIDSLLAMMTLEDKIGQLIQENGSEGHDDKIRDGQVGSILNVTDPEEINRLQHLAMDSSRLGIPIIFARDVIHGFKTIFPIPLGMAATFNPELVERSADIAATEASSVGIRWTFSPMVDVTRDPRWGRIAESFGEDSYLQSVMGAAMVRGYQGESLSEKGSIAACAKHFVAYGAAIGGRDYNTAEVPENILREVYLPPFKACIDAGVATIMPSFNEINGVPSTGNAFILDHILHKEWGFTGFVVSDWESVIQLETHGFTPDEKESAYYSFLAGTHMEMNSKAYANHLKELIDEKRISVDMLNDAVRRILRLKLELGLFDNPYTTPGAYPPILNENHRELARQTAAQSIVLLKNENHILPLNDIKGRIAVVGPLANSPHDQLGTWVFDGDKADAVTPLTSLREHFGENRIIYKAGMEISRSKDLFRVREAVRFAAQAEVIILFFGEESILSGESHCRADIGLPGVQEEFIRMLAETGTPLIGVAMAGRPLTFENVFEHFDALLYAWHPGTMAGPAITDILTGSEIPSGKLPVTFPRHVGQVPIYYSQKNTGKPANDSTWERMDEIPPEAPQLSIGNTNHYLDYGFEPWFPFGYGLSYTEFTYSDVKTSAPEIPLGGNFTISAMLKNTGDYEATEVVQLYIRDLVGSRTRPVKELKGFQRITLKPNEIKEVSFILNTRDVGFYNLNMDYVTEPGDFTAWIGGSSDAELSVHFTIK